MPTPLKTSAVLHPSFAGLSLVAGHPALDFVNTVKFRGAEDPQDKLQTFVDLVSWAQVSGLISGKQVGLMQNPNSGSKLLDEAVCLRENLWLIFNRTHVAKAAYLKAIEEMEAAIAALRPTVLIDPESGGLSRRVQINGPADLISRIVEAAADLFAERASLKIKTCDGCDCDWLFVDKTKAGRRRWCDTKTCGNLARVRDFRKKQTRPS